MDKIDFIKLFGELASSVETYTSEFYLNSTVFDGVIQKKEDYLRLQIDTSLAMDKSDKKNLDDLESDGLTLWKRHATEVKVMLRKIIDEKELQNKEALKPKVSALDETPELTKLI